MQDDEFPEKAAVPVHPDGPVAAPAPDRHDPKGLIRESFRIEGITAAECRSVFLDWALSLPVGTDVAAFARALIARHAAVPAGEHQPQHPMTQVLHEGLNVPDRPQRRGGRAARLAPKG